MNSNTTDLVVNMDGVALYEPSSTQIWSIICKFANFYCFFQKQPSRGVLRKKCSKNMLQVYRRTTMPKYDFNKVAKQLYCNCTSAWVFSWKCASYFQNTFSDEHIRRAASVLSCVVVKNQMIQTNSTWIFTWKCCIKGS